MQGCGCVGWCMSLCRCVHGVCMWVGWVPCTPSFTLSSLLPNHLLFSSLLQLKSLHPFVFGDSSITSDHTKMQEFVQQLQEVKMLSPEWTYHSLFANHTFLSHTHTHTQWNSYCATVAGCDMFSTMTIYMFCTTQYLRTCTH